MDRDIFHRLRVGLTVVVALLLALITHWGATRIYSLLIIILEGGGSNA